MITFLIIIFLSNFSEAKIKKDYYLTAVSELGSKAIDKSQCKEMEEKVGQLLYINVDGYGSGQDIHSDYIELIKRIQPGGILPHYNTENINSIRKTSKKLQESSKFPLMIGVDYQSLGDKTQIGLGYGAGITRELGALNASCYKKYSLLEAALHKYVGINQPLGPTVEFNTNQSVDWKGILDFDLDEKTIRIEEVINSFKEMGLETTLKHFPFTPSDFNLHKDNKDTKIPAKEIDQKYLPIFTHFANSTGFIMSTHTFNSNVDPNNMVTFSKKWVKKLREEVGFRGILMTDALFMIASYNSSMKSMAIDWPVDQPSVDEQSLFAIKAILAGHDMVFIATSATQTENLWKDLVKFSCRNSKFSEEFRKRIFESYNRIINYKKANPKIQDEGPNLSSDEINTLLKVKSMTPEKICSENQPEVEKIINKFIDTPTKIDSSVFPCATVELGNTELIRKINLLNDQFNNQMLPKLLKKALFSSDPKDVNFARDFFRNRPEFLGDINIEAKKLMSSKSEKDIKSGLELMAVLEMWNGDSSIIDNAIAENREDFIDYYVDSLKKADLPRPTTKNAKEAIINLSNYLKRNPLNLRKKSNISENISNAIMLFITPRNLFDLSWTELAELKLDPQVALIIYGMKASLFGVDVSKISKKNFESVYNEMSEINKNPNFKNMSFNMSGCVTMGFGYDVNGKLTHFDCLIGIKKVFLENIRFNLNKK